MLEELFQIVRTNNIINNMSRLVICFFLQKSKMYFSQLVFTLKSSNELMSIYHLSFNY